MKCKRDNSSWVHGNYSAKELGVFVWKICPLKNGVAGGRLALDGTEEEREGRPG